MLDLDYDRLSRLLLETGTISTEPVKWGKVKACSGGLLQASGFDYPIGVGAEIESGYGREIGAEIVGFDDDMTMLAPFDQHVDIRVEARVRPALSNAQVDVGPQLMGRIIDPLGHPLDDMGPIQAEQQWPLMGKPSNILNRGSITQPLDVGVQAINALLPIGRGQRMALIAGSGVGKTVLMRQLTSGTQADVIVVGLIGERAREVNDFVAASRTSGIADKSAIIAVPADHSPILRIKAAQRAAAIAEYFRSEGKSVLLVIDSLTRIAHAQREIGLAAGEPPTMKGYPPSAIALIPQLLERAGCDEATGGFITAFYTVLADGDDLDDPIVDAARAIADGHIILSRELAEQGVFPAIDIGKSISRVANDIIQQDHGLALRSFRSLWSQYAENRDLITMGAYRAGSDSLLDEAIARRPDQLSFLQQSVDTHASRESSVSRLIDGFGS
ncbi:FliI/YscN family ATPase [Parasphingorhabdus cellanae]|uniref:Flagellum-specific ATP synthase n=1 Tax=Parasphingorhabdus cellanae TaxID=2806553 RepID=A0ABX7T4G8_9SPHN|nr:FliI/YscN family ATPase [Parasphingorhabdus cellanae]QTD56479.1 FliI/YscN family ATPase [Parasphingorhabdus cellanae]